MSNKYWVDKTDGVDEIVAGDFNYAFEKMGDDISGLGSKIVDTPHGGTGATTAESGYHALVYRGETSADCNTLTASGIWMTNGGLGTYEAKHYPDIAGLLVVSAGGNPVSIISQTFYTSSDYLKSVPIVFTRRCIGSGSGAVWSEWAEHYTTLNPPDNATTEKAGFMSTSDKVKLNGIEDGANKTVTDSTLSSESENPIQNKAVASALAQKADKSTTLSGYGITDAYTKTETDDNITSNISESEEKADGKYANVLRGTKSGAAVGIHDVSPIEHTLTVNVSGAADPTAVTVSKFGANVDNIADITHSSNTAYGSITKRETLISGITYTLSSDFAQTGTPTAVGISVRSSSGTTIVKTANYTDIQGRAKVTFTVPDDGVVIFVFFSNITATAVVGASCTYSRICLEVGATEGKYSEYTAPITYTPSASGMVVGVTSVYPSVTLMADTAGAVINTEYNRDLNKAIAELHSAIVSLGGNV